MGILVIRYKIELNYILTVSRNYTPAVKIREHLINTYQLLH